MKPTEDNPMIRPRQVAALLLIALLHAAAAVTHLAEPKLRHAADTAPAAAQPAQRT